MGKSHAKLSCPCCLQQLFSPVLGVRCVPGDCPAHLGSSLGGGEPGGACPAGEQSCGFLCLCSFCRAAAPRVWKPKLFLQQLLFCLAQGQLVGSPQLRFPVAISQVGRPCCCLGWRSTVSTELTLACSKGGGIVWKPGSLNSPELISTGLVTSAQEG